MSEVWTGRLRTLGTLVALAVLLVVGVSWGWSAVKEPFPEKAETPLCVESTLQKGDVLRPGAITVSVLNAGDKNGLAGRTMFDLVERGFAEGRQVNAPDDATTKTAVIWTPDGVDAAVRLVRTYLGGKVKVVLREGPEPGLNIVVGDQFPGVRKGRKQVRPQKPVTVCSPTEVASTPSG